MLSGDSNYVTCLIKSIFMFGEVKLLFDDGIINLQDVDGLIQKKAYKVLSIILRVSPFHCKCFELLSSLVSVHFDVYFIFQFSVSPFVTSHCPFSILSFLMMDSCFLFFWSEPRRISISKTGGIA